MKINRNSLCYCGSGKVFKKCCANIKKEDRIFNDELINFVRNNNSLELLEFVSYLQLIPENSSKIIRLEEIQHKIIHNLHDNYKDKRVDYKKLKQILDKNYSVNHNEDPSESCFSENIMFLNGNNIVFPGIASNFTETNQLILNSIFLNQNKLPESFKKEIGDGTFIHLYLHNKIAKKLGIKRYEFINDYRGKISFPKNLKLENFKNLFKIEKAEIEDLRKSRKIEYNILNDISIKHTEVDEVGTNESNLIRKPFITYKNEYYLALPSAQMFSLNVYLINKIKEHNYFDEFKKSFLEVSKNEGQLAFRQMGWEISSQYEREIDFEGSILKFDTNKFAVIVYDLQTNEIKSNYDKIKKFIKKNKGDNSFILISIQNNFDLEFPNSTYLPYLKDFDYQIITSLQDLLRLNVNWKLEKRDIWKYLKAKDRAEKKGLNFPPFFSILTYFSYYMKNEKSFFQSDDKNPDFIYFTYDIQGNKVIEALQKEDKHLVHYINEMGGYGFVPVRKYQTIPHAPLYLADTIFNGETKFALEKYNFTIWITSLKDYDLETKNFVEAISYWLNEVYPSLNSVLNNVPNIPVNIEISLEEDFYCYTTDDISKNKNSKINFEYSINQKLNKIGIVIPSNIHNLISRNDNYGEKILMDIVLKGLFELFDKNFNITLDKNIISRILEIHMPLSMAKMIIAGNTIDNIQLDNRYISNNVERLNKADTSIVLEEMISWINIGIQEKIESKEEKIEVCEKGINTLINKIREVLLNFNSIELLKFIILRNETLLNNNAFKQMRAVTYYECFKNYKDAVNEYIEEDSKNIRTSLSIRNLIEFIVAEPYYGTKTPNNDDIDFLIALVDELIFLGTTKDLLKFDMDNPEMGKLPSGRLGINKDYFDKINVFSVETKKDEHYEYVENFTSNPPKKDIDKGESDKYYDKIDSVFLEEFGIQFFKIRALMYELAHFCYENKTSYLIYQDSEFEKVLKNEFNLTTTEIQSFLGHFSLNSRGKIGIPPDEYDYQDIFPWRYNRKLSYLSKPIIRIKDENGIYKNIISARHLVSSVDNFFALFFNGSLKINSDFRRLNSLLAERNNIKGKEFRNEVYNWLCENTSLEIIPYEFKIPVKGNDKNYGDVDILAFDKRNKIIYSIECKNTKQAKILYEFQRDAKNYINKQLPKHQNRTEWLKNNLEFLNNRFKYDFSKFKVEAYLISSYSLPIKLIQDIDNITIVSFNRIKRNNIF